MKKSSISQKENFENYVALIHECLEKLNNEEIGLQESMKLYKEGMETLNKAQKMLEEAKIQCYELKEQFAKKGKE
ncbi:MAG: exodeoxyribonuclease VII small subunit [Helicobacter sp.]|nr:exodeoxyribonuclease VII small subunit [Helicobacter sp.]